MLWLGMLPTSNPIQISATRRQLWLSKIAVFLAASVFLGWFYGWAGTRFFPENARVGFKHGVLHGALMPMALPSLLMGKDVKIYAENNTGRNYKLGYICGINLCGLAFFGPLFWRPKRRPTDHKNQPR
jgi:hypothetical protein